MNYRALVIGAMLGFALSASLVPQAHAKERMLDQTNLIKSLNGTTVYLGTIQSSDGGCFNNLTNQVLWDAGLMTDAGVATDTSCGTNSACFLIPLGANTLTQCDGLDVRINYGYGTSTAATANRSLRLSGQASAGAYNIGEKYPALLSREQNAIAICPLDAGTAVGCKVFEVQ